MRLSAGLVLALMCGPAASAAEIDADRLMGAAFAHEPARTTKLKLSARDTLRVSVRDAPEALRLDRPENQADAYEIAVTREWAGVRLAAGAYDLRLAPRAGVGVGRAGGQAEAGAMLTLGQRADDAVRDRLAGLGVKDGEAFGEQGRWYLFAAASGRAVGMNLLRGDAGLDRAGWSTDTASKLVGDAHVGVAWRKGDMQTAFGVIHREVKGQHMVWGQETRDDTMVALSFAIRPE